MHSYTNPFCKIQLLIIDHISDADYNTGPYTVTFPAGINRTLLSVTISDDNTVEENENFILFIDRSSLPNNVAIGDRSQTTVTIVDDDSTMDDKCKSSGLAAISVRFNGGKSIQYTICHKFY